MLILQRGDIQTRFTLSDGHLLVESACPIDDDKTLKTAHRWPLDTAVPIAFFSGNGRSRFCRNRALYRYLYQWNLDEMKRSINHFSLVKNCQQSFVTVGVDVQKDGVYFSSIPQSLRMPLQYAEYKHPKH